VTSKKRKETRA